MIDKNILFEEKETPTEKQRMAGAGLLGASTGFLYSATKHAALDLKYDLLNSKLIELYRNHGFDYTDAMNLAKNDSMHLYRSNKAFFKHATISTLAGIAISLSLYKIYRYLKNKKGGSEEDAAKKTLMIASKVGNKKVQAKMLKKIKNNQ